MRNTSKKIFSNGIFYFFHQLLNQPTSRRFIILRAYGNGGELPWCPPYGYKHHQFEDKRKTVISVQPKAQIVREIHIEYSTGSYSCRSLTKELNAEFKTKLPTTPLQYVTEDDSNSVVFQVLKEFKIPEDKLTEIQKALNDSHEDEITFYEAKRKELIAKRKRLSNRKQTMYDLLAYKCITPQKYNENNERHNEELREIQCQEEWLDKADKQFYINIGYLLAIFQHAEKLFEVADVSEKHQIVSLILSNLQLDGKNPIFNLKEPFDKLINLSKGSYGWG